jgi:GrpB-like predicted nucleotidyltransferase (UPF0157 family)
VPPLWAANWSSILSSAHVPEWSICLDALGAETRLETAGFQLTGRESWYGQRMLRAGDPPCSLHVFGFDSAELVRHRIFRDWLRATPANATGTPPPGARPRPGPTRAASNVMQYNARKQRVIREIYHWAFIAAGLLQQ